MKLGEKFHRRVSRFVRNNFGHPNRDMKFLLLTANRVFFTSSRIVELLGRESEVLLHGHTVGAEEGGEAEKAGVGVHRPLSGCAFSTTCALAVKRNYSALGGNSVEHQPSGAQLWRLAPECQSGM